MEPISSLFQTILTQGGRAIVVSTLVGILTQTLEAVVLITLGLAAARFKNKDKDDPAEMEATINACGGILIIIVIAWMLATISPWAARLASPEYFAIEYLIRGQP